MGEGIPNERVDHGRLILRAVRAGLAVVDERAEHLTFAGQRYRIHLYTDDGSCLTGELAFALCEALDET